MNPDQGPPIDCLSNPSCSEGDESCGVEVFCENAVPCYPNCPPVIFVSIPGGRFSMGSDTVENEGPIREIDVQAFEIGKREVTVGEYRACVQNGECTPPVVENCIWTRQPMEFESHPINCVSWEQLRDFALWIGADLPAEAQWEYVAKNMGSTSLYPWEGESPIESCRFANLDFGDENGSGCQERKPRVTCRFSEGETSLEVCDMIGNVWEWTLDEYQSNYDIAITMDQPVCTQIDCAGDELTRTQRGGSFSTPLDGITNTTRASALQATGYTSVGGRVVRRPTSGR